MRARHLLPALILLGIACPAAAQVEGDPALAVADDSTATPLDARAADLVDLLAGRIAYADYFDQAFIDAVPRAQFDAITASLIVAHGAPQGVASVERSNDTAGTVKIAFERAVGAFAMQVGPAPDHRVAGLRVLGFETPDDSFDRVTGEIDALPGSAGYLVAELDGTAIKPIAGFNTDAQFAIGSTFKLYILDELAAQVAAGEHRWDSVVPLSQQSFSSLGTNNWPKDTPVTIQSLASWMISVSDNSATDTLIRLLSRERIEARVAAAGHSDPARLAPFLTTVEAFALKGDNFAEQRAAFIAGDETAQRAVIDDNQGRLTLANVDARALAGGPRFIDSLEWFASSMDIARLMIDLRARQSETMLSVMAINPAVSPEAAAAWTYLGYKGGSENGVVSMSLLGQRKNDARWFVVTASWNDPDAAVSNEKLLSLVTRLLALAAKS